VRDFPDDEEESTADSIFSLIDSNFSQVLPFVEETIEKWNSRTQMIKNINSSSAQINKSVASNRTILEQVNSLVMEPANLAKLVEKSKLKKDNLKPLGRLASDHMQANERDEHIYNDHDFYQSLLKDFLASNDGGHHEADNIGGEDDNDIYVDGANLGMT
jgi:hypothetical protein